MSEELLWAVVCLRSFRIEDHVPRVVRHFPAFNHAQFAELQLVIVQASVEEARALHARSEVRRLFMVILRG